MDPVPSRSLRIRPADAASHSACRRASGALPTPRCHRLVATFLVMASMPHVAGCDGDGVGPDPDPPSQEVGVVVNSVDLSLSVFPVDSPGVVRPAVGLAPDGSPVAAAVRNGLAAVPMGLLPAVAVVDLQTGALAHVQLPENSGATGAAFLNDSVVLAANPNLDNVTPVNVVRGSTGPAIPVGGYPHFVLVVDDRVVVLNAELGPDFEPAGPGTATILDRESLEVLGQIQLSGTNPGAAAASGDGNVWVLSSGTFGSAGGSLSLVDPVAMEEVEHHEGFGLFPSAVAVDPAGLVYVSSFSYGVALWDPQQGDFLRGPDDAVAPGGTPSASGVAFDSEGRLYTVLPDCSGPGAIYQLGPTYAVQDTRDVGTCPVGLTFDVVGG